MSHGGQECKTVLQACDASHLHAMYSSLFILKKMKCFGWDLHAALMYARECRRWTYSALECSHCPLWQDHPMINPSSTFLDQAKSYAMSSQPCSESTTYVVHELIKPWMLSRQHIFCWLDHTYFAVPARSCSSCTCTTRPICRHEFSATALVQLICYWMSTNAVATMFYADYLLVPLWRLQGSVLSLRRLNFQQPALRTSRDCGSLSGSNTHNSAIASADNTALSQIEAIDDLYQALQGPHTHKTRLYCIWQAITISVCWNALTK